MASLLAEARDEYHRRLIRDQVLGVRQGELNNADRANESSKEIARDLARQLSRRLTVEVLPTNLSGQTLGTQFGVCTKDFLASSFDQLGRVRPGPWHYSTESAISNYEQYRHLAEMKRLADENRDLRMFLGSGYVVIPDIIVSREKLADTEFGEGFIDPADGLATRTPLRRENQDPDTNILHASISCKWTMRSDRAQNTRTEALNLIRLRKGRTPIIVAVTAEPLPSRLASLALGTGDIDKIYHFALDELVEAVRRISQDQTEILDDLLSGGRIADISDLPFDLAI